MKNFSNNKRTDRKKDFGKRQGRDSERPMMHKATCDHCGRDCEVPFKPTSGKPIYCSSCFDKHQNKDQKKYGSERDDRRFNSGENRRRGNDNEKGTNQLGKEIAQLNKKLDRILEILNSELYDESYDDFEEKEYSPKLEKKPKKRTTKKSK
ncbi:MAG: hypothetical protein KDC88_17035 [Ignavibacteriae bacterium]|nr:hypothetical protein [Ignavibacteriota bacterium]